MARYSLFVLKMLLNTNQLLVFWLWLQLRVVYPSSKHAVEYRALDKCQVTVYLPKG